MFWLGLLIALLSGLAGIGFSRDSVKDRFPWVRDFHLDWAALALLTCGLSVSAIDHVLAERQIESLAQASRSVRSFEIDFDVQFTSDWTGSPPASPRVMVMGQSPVARIELALKSDEVRTLDLYMDREPSFAPSDDGWVHTIFRVKAVPGSWIVASDVDELDEIRKLTFSAYGVRLQDSRDGLFTIGAKSRVFVNGRQVAQIEFKPQRAALSQLRLGDKNPEMSFNGNWAIHSK
jgi:hypothetical protein